jgi:ribosomal-protein-alanine N-acetyltransferase
MSSPLPEHVACARLSLRRVAISDASAIFSAYAQDALVCRYMVWRPHASEAVTREYLASCDEAWESGKRLAFVLTEPAGDTAFGMIEARLQPTCADIGYVLARDRWGNGLMGEAVKALASLLLQAPGIFRVQAACDTENLASQRVLEKAGLRREGRLERYTVHPNLSDEPRACFMYAVVR